MLPIFLCLVYIPAILIALVRLPYTNRQHIFLHVGLLNSAWDSSSFSNLLSLPSSPSAPRLSLPPAPPPASSSPAPSIVPAPAPVEPPALDPAPAPTTHANPNGSDFAHNPKHKPPLHREYAMRVPRLLSSYRILTRSSNLKIDHVHFIVYWLRAWLRFSSYSPRFQDLIAFILGLEFPVYVVAAVRIASRVLCGVTAPPDVQSVPKDPQPQTPNAVISSHLDALGMSVETTQKEPDGLRVDVEGAHAQSHANKLESVHQPVDPQLPLQTVIQSSLVVLDSRAAQKGLGDFDAEDCPSQSNAGNVTVESFPPAQPVPAKAQLVDPQPHTEDVLSQTESTASGTKTKIAQEGLAAADPGGLPQAHASKVHLGPDRKQNPLPCHLLLLDGVPLEKAKADTQLQFEDQILHYTRNFSGLCAHHKTLLSHSQSVFQEAVKSITYPQLQAPPLPLLLHHPAPALKQESLHQADTNPNRIPPASAGIVASSSSSESGPSSAAPLTCQCPKHDVHMLD